MVNSVKTSSSKAKKGQVSVREDSKSIKACFPRNYFADGKQVKLSTGIPLVSGWEVKAGQLQRRLQLELEEGKLDDGSGNFNIGRYQEILQEYGLKASLKNPKLILVSDNQLPPKPELSSLEIWDIYCEYQKREWAITTVDKHTGIYRRYLDTAINHVGDNALQIREWLLDNRDHQNVKKILSHLSKAYALVIRQNLYSGKNYFDGLTEGIGSGKRVKEIKQDEYREDDEVESKDFAFTWDEAESIMEFLRTSEKPRFNHWYHFVSFKFLTGCRQGEAIALWWGDVKWDREIIVIDRSYSSTLRKFKPTKNETTRIFPMPKDGRLWNLLKELPQGEPNEVVFKNREGNTIHHCVFGEAWKGKRSISKSGTYYYPGIIETLIDEGKVSKYLPPYNTRHTFITHQIYDLNREKDIVNAWCEHGEKISAKHYRNTSQIALQINPELPANSVTQQSSDIEALKEELKQQQEKMKQQEELIRRLLENKNN
ncbi:tyrosine recombinase XerC [Nostoc sp. FACHB-190]|uniref:site-specific integrase n=1 Tax=Nostoc sp. FACHB-190 TaxID=2692838 RepID=UPI001684326E|nr:tyrosine-type recombinase/integrase [Nostoc sp. FACHB-190]MBD2298747.1 tyrosine-type recombinase/integrase [Nostoc sp. FACHB-190]